MENFNSYKNVADLFTANSKYEGESMNKTNLYFSETDPLCTRELSTALLHILTCKAKGVSLHATEALEGRGGIAPTHS
jgi:hypothetical protein